LLWNSIAPALNVELHLVGFPSAHADRGTEVQISSQYLVIWGGASAAYLGSRRGDGKLTADSIEEIHSK
jgi:hypothetical protein